MTRDRVRLGYIGAGRFSRNRLLPNFRTMTSVDLIAVCNSSDESSNRVAEQFGFERTETDWRHIVTAEDIDAVVVGTRTGMHPEMVIPLLDAGKHVLTLNAIAPDLNGAKAMLDEAKKHPQLISLVFPGQFYLREHAMMGWLLTENYVGRVLHVFDYWYTKFFGLGSQFEVAHRWFGDHTEVMGYRKGFDIVSNKVDHHERKVRQESNVVQAELTNGATVTYIHSTIAGDSAMARFEIYGDRGVLVCYQDGQSKTGFFGAKSTDAQLIPIPIPEHLKKDWTKNNGIPVEDEFIRAIVNNDIPSNAIPRFEDGVKLLEFAQAWSTSTKAKAWESVKNT